MNGMSPTKIQLLSRILTALLVIALGAVGVVDVAFHYANVAQTLGHFTDQYSNRYRAWPGCLQDVE